jgi:hypothetical protein
LKTMKGLKGSTNGGRIEFAIEKKILSQANHQLLAMKLADAGTRTDLIDIEANGISAEIDNPYTHTMSPDLVDGWRSQLSRGKRFSFSL